MRDGCLFLFSIPFSCKAGSNNYYLLLQIIWAYSDRHTPDARLVFINGPRQSDFIVWKIIVHTFVNTMSYAVFEWDEARKASTREIELYEKEI